MSRTNSMIKVFDFFPLRCTYSLRATAEKSLSVYPVKICSFSIGNYVPAQVYNLLDAGGSNKG